MVLLRGLILLIAFLLLPAIIFVVDARSYGQSRYEPGAVTEPPAGATPSTHDPAKPTAVVVVGNDGANVADTLAPYHVLAATQAFNVYVVAPERRPLPLLGGLDLVPDLSFAELAQRLKGSAPDVTVVPEMPRSQESDAKVTAWLRETASDGLLLGVCTGARLLAAAGLLDGREATTHWYRLSDLQSEFPRVKWQRGMRYLDGGEIITTGGLLSSIDGALRVVERLTNARTAAKAAETVGWRLYSPGKSALLSEASLTPANALTHLLNLGYRADHTTVGVLLTEGVGELHLAAAFGPYGEVKAARTLAIGAGPLRSSHGLTFIPRAPATAARDVDYLLVPGSGASDAVTTARNAGVPVTTLTDTPGFPFDATLRDMGHHLDTPTARWAAKILEYPTTTLNLTGPAAPWNPLLRLLLLGLPGLALALLIIRRRHARQP